MQWPGPPDEAMQAEWASAWMSLAASKPFVRSITWSQLSDGVPHLFPNAGLLRADATPKPVVKWLQGFRDRISQAPKR